MVHIILAHPGTQHSFRLAAELDSRGVLGGFYTGWAFTHSGCIDRIIRWMPTSWQRKLSSRRIAGVKAGRLHTRPITEAASLFRQRQNHNMQDVMHWRNERFQQSIDDRRLSAASAVIGFDTASWILAERCAKFPVPMILDQTTCHPDSKLSADALAREQHPEWCDGVTTRPSAIRAAEQIEHDRAARIVVASSFTRRTLTDQGVDAERIRVNPYGVDSDRFHVMRRSNSRSMRFVFVGAMNARKGVPLLIDAWRQVVAAGSELWLIGPVSKEAITLVPELPSVKCFGPVPHSEVADLMQLCDVFVFPSYFEGFGLVILEAMACGLPVITTKATAGPDIITCGNEGWIIDPGDLPALVERMTFCLEHPEIVRDMGRQARAAAERLSWTAYGDRWMQILHDICA